MLKIPSKPSHHEIEIVSVDGSTVTYSQSPEDTRCLFAWLVSEYSKFYSPFLKEINYITHNHLYKQYKQNH